MSSNPYEAPAAAIDAAELGNHVSIPEEVSKQIRNAVGAGVFTGTITLIFSVITVLMRAPIMGINAWALLDVALVYSLTFGIYRKSRVCAVLMLVYYVGNKILQIVAYHTYGAVLLGLVFSYLYAMGVAGTFQYHEIRNEAAKP